VSQSERVIALDVLRGFALFGVLLSNLNDWYGTPAARTALERGLAFVQKYFVEGRFVTLLSFMFGLGFAIQLMRAEARGRAVRGMYYRRCAALLAIGVVHGTLVWSGDILTTYALLGCVLLLFRGMGRRGLLASAAACLVLGRYVMMLAFRAAHLRTVPRIPETTADWVYAHGSYALATRQHVIDYLDWHGRWPAVMYWYTLALFLFGLWLGRSGLLTALTTDRRLLRRVALAGVAAAVVGAAAGYLIDTRWAPLAAYPEGGIHDPHFWSPRTAASVLADSVETMGMSAAYAALIVLTLIRGRAGARLFGALVPVGRMALTTYLTQSVVCQLVFSGYGLGYYGRVGFGGMLVFSLVLFAVQVAVSRWWLARFEFGPAEWVWRTLTYGRRRFRRSTASSRGSGGRAAGMKRA
jgi:uncharacterized protein